MYREYRRVTFFNGQTSDDWSIRTEIIRPTGPDPKDEFDQTSFDPDKTTLGSGFVGIPFEDYLIDGRVDWENKKHVCIDIDHAGSHKQLWVLSNATLTLHNFHIHQMKFRLATSDELKSHFIKQPNSPRTCDPPKCGDMPSYELFDDQTSGGVDPGGSRRWHDTIPLPPGQEVFVIMSFDTSQQIGKFVFHCHILKHEDKGLMAPIEVWGTLDWSGVAITGKQGGGSR